MEYSDAEIKVSGLELLIALSNLEAVAYEAQARDLQNKAAVCRARASNIRDQICNIWQEVCSNNDT